MATIDDIKQIAMGNEVVWPNDLHIGHYGDQIELIDREFDVENPAPAKLQPYIDELKAAYQQENRAYKQPSKSELTEQIAEADKERDSLVSQVKTIRDAFEKMDALPTKQQAAKKFGQLWDVYKPDTNAAYERENEALTQWHEDFLASQEQQDAATELGLTTVITQMMEKTALVHQLIVQRGLEQAGRADIVLKDARAMTDQAFRHFCMMIDALALVDADETRFEVILSSMIEKQDYYRELYETARRANRRVSVKSTIVGNKLYSFSNGWTWEQLIADGKAALAVDTEDPTHIVSTDKKALKVGGLVLALDGYAVHPGDDIDIEQEYELVYPGNILPDVTPTPTPEPDVTPVTPE